MKHVCYLGLQLIRLCVINVTKCLVKSHCKVRDHHEYQRKRLFLAHDIEGCNLKVFSLE